MKIKRVIREEIDAEFVWLRVDVRYDEEDMPNGFPGRTGDSWCVRIGLDDGRLCLYDGKPFPADVTCDLHMKVCDAGAYCLTGETGIQLCGHREDYVPGFFPGNHYGDYLILDIAEGRVRNWKKPKASDVQAAFGLNEADE